jgi:hypothetical protein
LETIPRPISSPDFTAPRIASEEEIKSGLALRCRSISEMLMERRVLDEAQRSERSRRCFTAAFNAWWFQRCFYFSTMVSVG